VKQGASRTAAIVRQCLPNAMYRVELPGGSLLTAHVTGDARAKMSRLIVGDEVLVEVTPLDRGVGRILGRRPGTRGR
jgi:translation initiation factor IF-1